MKPVITSLLMAVLLGSAMAANAEVTVEGLMPGAAVLNIGGQRKLLKVGQSHGGVTLLEATGDSALLEIDGRQRSMGLSTRIDSQYEEPEERVVTIARNDRNQYLTNALINGRSTLVLVDTGANIMALSTRHARELGVNYRLGEPSRVRTASGVADAYSVTLDSVSVGGIRVDNVRASVVDGDYPENVLLGMSYLNHVRIEESGGVLSLTKTR